MQRPYAPRGCVACMCRMPVGGKRLGPTPGPKPRAQRGQALGRARSNARITQTCIAWHLHSTSARAFTPPQGIPRPSTRTRLRLRGLAAGRSVDVVVAVTRSQGGKRRGEPGRGTWGGGASPAAPRVAHCAPYWIPGGSASQAGWAGLAGLALAPSFPRTSTRGLTRGAACTAQPWPRGQKRSYSGIRSLHPFALVCFPCHTDGGLPSKSPLGFFFRRANDLPSGNTN